MTSICTAEGTVRLWDVATSQPLGAPLAHRFAVWDVRFAADGQSFSSTDRRGITKHWPVPEPARGEPAALQTLLETWGRTQLTDGVPTPLSQEEWRQHKSIVEGFPPGSVWFPDPISEPAWHESRATDAEGDVNWYTAWWHLERLVTARPNDWQLRARRGRIQVLRGEPEAAEIDFAKAAELEGRKALLDWFAHCAYTCREDQTFKSALYFPDRLVAAEPDEWQWRADQEEAFEKLGRQAEAQAAFGKALELCRPPIIPALAAELTQAGNWAVLHKELSRGEKTGWLSLEDWKLWARSAKEFNDQAAPANIFARFKERAGPDSPLGKQLTP